MKLPPVTLGRGRSGAYRGTQPVARVAPPRAAVASPPPPRRWYQRRVSELEERRRFERALHDGVLQDLIALTVQLQLARQLLTSDDGEAAALLEELRQDVHKTIGSVRTLANEIYPSILDARGLGDALRGVPHVRAHDLRRHSPELEAAVYFCCVTADAEIDVYENDDDEGLRIELRGTVSSPLRALAEAAGATFYESAR